MSTPASSPRLMAKFAVPKLLEVLIRRRPDLVECAAAASVPPITMASTISNGVVGVQSGAGGQGSGDGPQQRVKEVPNIVEHREFLGENFTERQRSQNKDGLVRNQPGESGREMNHVAKSRKKGEKEKRQIGVDAAR